MPAHAVLPSRWAGPASHQGYHHLYSNACTFIINNFQ